MIKYTMTGREMVLDEETTKAWEDAGPEGALTRREIVRDATVIAGRVGQVEIVSSDGIVLEAIPSDWR